MSKEASEKNLWQTFSDFFPITPKMLILTGILKKWGCPNSFSSRCHFQSERHSSIGVGNSSGKRKTEDVSKAVLSGKRMVQLTIDELKNMPAKKGQRYQHCSDDLKHHIQIVGSKSDVKSKEHRKRARIDEQRLHLISTLYIALSQP